MRTRKRSLETIVCALLVPLMSASVFVRGHLPRFVLQILFSHIGEDRKLADFQKVAAAAPDRVKFEQIGKSTLGKPFVVMTVSSPENIGQLLPSNSVTSSRLSPCINMIAAR